MGRAIEHALQTVKLHFYHHARISAGRNVDTGASIDPVYGREHFSRQMDAAVKSGLIENCEQFTIGLNGTPADLGFVESIVPAKVRTILHSEGSESLLPTMQLLQRELKDHPDAMIGFAHTKSITRPGNRLYQNWLGCLQCHVVEDWRRCVSDLKTGQFDAVGVHWTHNSPNDPNADRWGKNSFFPGVFWWVTAKYLLTLPELPEKPTDRHSWFLPELWLGNGKPRILDYHPGPIFIHA